MPLIKCASRYANVYSELFCIGPKTTLHISDLNLGLLHLESPCISKHVAEMVSNLILVFSCTYALTEVNGDISLHILEHVSHVY